MEQDRRIFIKSLLVQQGLPLAFLFVLFWSSNVVHVQTEDGHSTARTKFCYDRNYAGHRLNSGVIKNLSSLSAVDCVVYCVREPCCRSTNYRKHDSFDGNENCELLHALASEQLDDLKKDERYDYYILLQPVKSNFTGKKCSQEPKRCDSLTKNKLNGIYTIDPDGLGAFDVRCDMENDGGGWTVFQRRMDGSENFNRNWSDYKNGFGNLSGEFWLGLDKIHRLSMSGLNVLRIDMKDINNKTNYAEYNIFAVSNEADLYKLTVGNYSGNVTADSLNYHNGMNFSTADEDHDMASGYHCASSYKSGWWYKHCFDVNLNGLYHNHSNSLGMRWKSGNENIGDLLFLINTEMKIRPRN